MKTWLKKLLNKRQLNEQDGRQKPSLLKATAFTENDIGAMAWDTELNYELLSFSNDDQSVEWKTSVRSGEQIPPAWIPASTRLYLHSGCFQWDFVVEEMASWQIGVGFMLLWDAGLDWGFFGYLGASSTAWSYDPSSGDVVTATESIQGGLPKFEQGRSGVVTVELDIPRESEGQGKFKVGDVESKPIILPASAVVQPAACLLKQGQGITLANFERK